MIYNVQYILFEICILHYIYDNYRADQNTTQMTSFLLCVPWYSTPLEILSIVVSSCLADVSDNSPDQRPVTKQTLRLVTIRKQDNSALLYSCNSITLSIQM